MPGRSLVPCSGSPLCPELVEPGRQCPTHERERERARGSAHQRGYDGAWHRTRALYLRDHAPKSKGGAPCCEECGLSQTEVGSLHVDHIDGLGPLGPRGHDPANLQALCESCHGRKTRAQTAQP